MVCTIVLEVLHSANRGSCEEMSPPVSFPFPVFLPLMMESSLMLRNYLRSNC